MANMLANLVVLAEEAGDVAPVEGTGAQQANPMQGLLAFAPIIAIFVLFIWFTSRSQKKRQRQRENMLNDLRVKDDVVTIGGICGRIVRIQDDEIVLRIDPEKDIKITVTKGGIGRKLGEEEPG